MAYALRHTISKTEYGTYHDHFVLELTASELREEIASAEKNSTEKHIIKVTKIDSHTAKKYIFQRGYIHGTGYWFDGERIRYAKGE